MKTLILATIILLTSITTSYARGSREAVEVCVQGTSYVMAMVILGNSVTTSIVQVFVPSDKGSKYPPQPKPCQ